MYRVYSDEYLLYDDAIDELKIFSPKLNLEMNKTGSFEFTIYPGHVYFGLVKKLKSIITVYQDDYLMFRGRVLNEEIGFHNEKHIVCEGELAFLLDSIQRPFEFSGTVADLFRQLITNHNSQVDESHRFTIGYITVMNPSAIIDVSSVDYKSTWNALNEYLIHEHCYVYTRYENGVHYIDYTCDFARISYQDIEFGLNLMDLKRIRKGDEIATAVIPLGAKTEGTEERLTIASVNGGSDYIYDADAVSEFGWIFKTYILDDVPDANTLLTEGRAYLASLVDTYETIELSAADLATVDASIGSFHLATYVRVRSDPHGIDQRFLVNKISIDLMNPAANRLVLGGVRYGYIENVKFDQETVVQNIQGKMETKIVQEVESRASSMIEQSAGEILFQVSEGYYTKANGNALSQTVSELNTSFTQTSTAFQMNFTSIFGDLTEVHQYIRFVAGNIILGESGNNLTLKIENDRITFFDKYHEVAYFSNDRLYVTDGEFTNSLRLGNFAFVPRSNGNLSFSKVV